MTKETEKSELAELKQTARIAQRSAERAREKLGLEKEKRKILVKKSRNEKTQLLGVVKKAEKKADSATAKLTDFEAELKRVKSDRDLFKKKAVQLYEKLQETVEKTQHDSVSATNLLEAANKELEKQKELFKNLDRRPAPVQLKQDVSVYTEELEKLRKELGRSVVDISEKDKSLQKQKTQSDEEKDVLRKRIEKLESEKFDSQWYLRREDESVYGPVSLWKMREWVAGCRVGPDSEVSVDGQHWEKAANMDALEMMWMVTLIDGTVYGPLNLFAVGYLVKNGDVEKGSMLKNKLTGETVKTSEMLILPPKSIVDQIKRIVRPVDSPGAN